MAVEPGARRPPDVSFAVRAFELTVSAVVIAVLVGAAISNPGQFWDWRLILWAVAVAAMDLMPVQGPASAQLSLSFPILLAAAFVFMPPVAAAIAAAGSMDQRELKRTIRPLKAVFVRSEVALSVLWRARCSTPSRRWRRRAGTSCRRPSSRPWRPTTW